MTSKKDFSNLSKAPKLDEPNNALRKRLTALALLLLLIVVGYFVWLNLQPSIIDPIKETPAKLEQNQTEESAIPTDINTVENITGSMASDESIVTTDAQPIEPETILNAPLPETNSLAKEEIDRLDDEHQRLIEQEKLATEQVQMNKKLTEMKAEQIELLEQQIAQLEAAQSAQ